MIVEPNGCSSIGQSGSTLNLNETRSEMEMDRHFDRQIAKSCHYKLVEKSLVETGGVLECFGRSRQRYRETIDNSGNPLIIQGREGGSDNSMEISRVTLDVDIGVMIVDFNNCVWLVRVSDKIVEKLVSIESIVSISHMKWNLSWEWVNSSPSCQSC